MKIGINALGWVPEHQAGVETYLRQLVAALQKIDSDNSYVIFVSRDGQGCLRLAAENFREVVCPTSSWCRPLRILWEQSALAGRARAEGVEVMLCGGGIVPRNLTVPAVQVIHDLQVFHHPENFPGIKRRFLRRMLPQSAQAAQFTIASSEFTREDVIKFLGQPRQKTRVVYLAAGPEFVPASAEVIALVKQRYGLSGDYLLYVGTGHPHRLVWAGLPGRAAACRQWQDEDVRALGRVPTEDLPPLYSGATALLVPSLFEGFGITALEAMQCRCPVACSDLAALPEVVGEAALLFDPTARKQFKQALERIVTDSQLRQSLRQKGSTRAAQFSWQSTARRTLAILKQAVE